MPNFKRYNYSQRALVVIDFEEQLQPGTFEFTLHKLIDNHIDLSAFHENYKNDAGGRSAYDPSARKFGERSVPASRSTRNSMAANPMSASAKRS